MAVHMCAGHVCVHPCGGQLCINNLRNSLSYFMRQSHIALGLSKQARLPGQQGPGFTHVWFPSSEITSACYHTWLLFYIYSRNWSRVLALQTFPWLSTLLNPALYFLNLIFFTLPFIFPPDFLLFFHLRVVFPPRFLLFSAPHVSSPPPPPHSVVFYFYHTALFKSSVFSCFIPHLTFTEFCV